MITQLAVFLPNITNEHVTIAGDELTGKYMMKMACVRELTCTGIISLI